MLCGVANDRKRVEQQICGREKAPNVKVVVKLALVNVIGVAMICRQVSMARLPVVINETRPISPRVGGANDFDKVYRYFSSVILRCSITATVAGLYRKAII